MIAQHELQTLLKLPARDRQVLIELLHNSLLLTPDDEAQLPASAPLNSAPESLNVPAGPANPLLAMLGIFDGGPGDSAERADEICQAEISRRSGFTTKPPLGDEVR